MLNTDDNILIWGAGGIGGTLGAYLARAGHPVTLVDTAPAQISAIRENGLSIVGPIETFTQRMPILAPEELEGNWPLIVLAVKAQFTEMACVALVNHLAPDGIVLSMQNGLSGEVVARHIGRRRTYTALVNFASDVLAPAEIRFGLRHAMPIGQIDGLNEPELDILIAILRDFEPATFAAPDIPSLLWGKHCFTAILCGSAVAESSMDVLMLREDLEPLWRNLTAEVIAVASGLGIRPGKFGPFEPIAFAPGMPKQAGDAYLQAVAVAGSAKGGKPHSGMWRDLAVHHRKTEVSFLMGPIADLGAAHGIACPLLRGTVEMVGEIEQGKRSQNDENLLELLRRMTDA